MRRDALAGMGQFGIAVDEERNLSAASGVRRVARISQDDSPTVVLVVPTNEELAIARDCVSVPARL